MRLSLTTKIHELLTTYPFLLDYLVGRAPEFGKLRSPVCLELLIDRDWAGVRRAEFVDENDEVGYYSGGEQRIFPRSPPVIGRQVQNCHPPKSLPTVTRILEAFRAGTRDCAEFWITMRGRFLHIRYFAVRDGERRYRGTLEVTQDVTSIRGLTGEHRLLDWAEAQ